MFSEILADKMSSFSFSTPNMGELSFLESITMKPVDSNITGLMNYLQNICLILGAANCLKLALLCMVHRFTVARKRR